MDWFPVIMPLSIANILTELGKYRVELVVLELQYPSQLDAQVRDSIPENVGTIISFRLDSSDAHILEREFSPEITADDLIGLPNYRIHLKLMVDKKITMPFMAETIVIKLNMAFLSDGNFKRSRNVKTLALSRKSKALLRCEGYINNIRSYAVGLSV